MASAPVAILGSRPAAIQPTWDTDEELGIKGRDDSDSDDDRAPAPVAVKRQKTGKSKPLPPKRLHVTSRSAFYSLFEECESAGYNVAVWVLNTSIRLPTTVMPMPCHAYRNDSPCENLDVDERVTPKAQAKKMRKDGTECDILNGWDPGRADLAGIAVAAWEIADHVVQYELNVAVVVSDAGGDAAKLLAGCAAQAIRRLATAEEAKSVIGAEAPQATKEQFKKIYKAFSRWTRTTAPHEIMDFAL